MGSKYSAQQFVNALPGTGGVISALARKVGCDWHTAKKFVNDFPTVKAAYEAEKYAVDDEARSVVIEDIVQGRNVETAKWWLRMKLSDEFSDKTQVEQMGDGLVIRVLYGTDGPSS